MPFSKSSAFGFARLKAENDERGNIINFTVLDVDQTMENIMGFKRDAMTGRQITELLPGLDQGTFNWLDFYIQVAEQRCTAVVNQYYAPQNKWYKVQAKYEGEGIISIILTDFSLEKAGEIDLQRFLDLNMNLHSISSLDGSIHRVNKAWKRILGYSDEEIERLNYFDLVHPEDRQPTGLATEKLRNNQQVTHFINRLRTSSGNYCYLEWRARTYDGLVYASARDVTDRMLREKQDNYQSALESMVLKLATEFIQLPPDGFDEQIDRLLKLIGSFAGTDRAYLFRYNFDKHITVNTHEWCAPGVPPEIDNLQHIPLETITEWVEQHLAGEMLHIPDVSHLNQQSNLYQILAPQGIKTLIAIPLMYEERCLGFVGFDDVQKLRQWSDSEISLLQMAATIISNAIVKHEIQREMVEAKEQAEAMSKAKSQFLANMSHEIRTPLNSVIGFTDLLVNTPLDDTQHQYARSAHASAHSLLDIINDVLDFSKIEADKLQLDEAETDLIKLVTETVDIVKHQAAKKELELLLNLDFNMPRHVVVDPVRLRQILINLLSNAVKFTEKGEIELELILKRKNKRDSRGEFHFSIRDTGIGIRPEQRGKLFEAFAQAESSTSRRYGGTGLGLTITSRLLEMMNSSLQLNSQPGRGSTFSFALILPYRQETKPFEPAVDHLRKVLIVDDNLNNRLILKDMLKQWDIDTIDIDNGSQAVHMLEEHTDIDLAIVDFNMPRMNGIETIRLIRKQSESRIAKLPIIMLNSSIDETAVKREAKALNVICHLNKPVLYENLFEALTRTTASMPVRPRQKPAAPPQAQKESPPTILLAEDFPMNMLLLKNFLQRLIPDATMLEASEGEEAVELAKKHQPDLIFMDIQMPKVDGYAATRSIRAMESENARRTTIIALTASAVKGEREKCLAAGMNEYLTKPIKQKHIEEVVSKYL